MTSVTAWNLLLVCCPLALLRVHEGRDPVCAARLQTPRPRTAPARAQLTECQMIDHSLTVEASLCGWQPVYFKANEIL